MLIKTSEILAGKIYNEAILTTFALRLFALTNGKEVIEWELFKQGEGIFSFYEINAIVQFHAGNFELFVGDATHHSLQGIVATRSVPKKLGLGSAVELVFSMLEEINTLQQTL